MVLGVHDFEGVDSAKDHLGADDDYDDETFDSDDSED